MTLKMNPEVKALWVADLRSGEHQQGKGKLKSSTGFCCLGRLTDLFINSPANTQGLRWGEGTDGTNYVKENGTLYNSYLPEAILKWAGVSCSYGGIIDISKKFPDWKAGKLIASDDGRRSLIHLNDNGATFAEIADLIEEQL